MTEPTMECTKCGEISLKHVDTLRSKKRTTFEYECVCGEIAYFDDRPMTTRELLAEIGENLVKVTLERDMNHDVYLAAKDVKDLDEAVGVPIRGGDRIIAKASMYQAINEVENELEDRRYGDYTAP